MIFLLFLLPFLSTGSYPLQVSCVSCGSEQCSQEFGSTVCHLILGARAANRNIHRAFPILASWPQTCVWLRICWPSILTDVLLFFTSYKSLFNDTLKYAKDVLLLFTSYKSLFIYTLKYAKVTCLHLFPIHDYTHYLKYQIWIYYSFCP